MDRHHRAAANAALIATRNPELARRMDRTIALEDGVLVRVPTRKERRRWFWSAAGQ